MISYEKFMTKRNDQFLHGNQTFVSQVETGKLESFNTPLLQSHNANDYDSVVYNHFDSDHDNQESAFSPVKPSHEQSQNTQQE